MAVPSARTFGALKTSILRYLKLVNDTTADEIAEDGIRSALVRLHSQPLRTMLASSDVTLTAAQNTISVPTDYNMPFCMHLLDTNDDTAQRIVYRDEETFNILTERGARDAGIPAIYTHRGGSSELEFDHAPSAANVSAYPQVRLRYFKRVDMPSLDTSTFTLAPEVEEFIVWHARAQLAEVYDPRLGPTAQANANGAFQALIRRDTVRETMDYDG